MAARRLLDTKIASEASEWPMYLLHVSLAVWSVMLLDAGVITLLAATFWMQKYQAPTIAAIVGGSLILNGILLSRTHLAPIFRPRGRNG